MLNLEYLKGLDDEISTRYGINVNPSGTVKEYLVEVFPKFTDLKPPDGLVYILDVNGQVEGMGALKRLDENVGEIKRMYIRPQFRGCGLGQQLYKLLEDAARAFGFSKLKLDTAGFAEAAVHIYRKVGFVEVGVYSGGEWETREDTDGITMYMEKHLNR